MCIIDVTEANFEAIIQRIPVPVILDVWADWCEPCKQLTPKLEALAKKHQGRILLAKLNADVHQELAVELQVRNLPSVFGIFNGKLVDRFVGSVTDEQLTKFVDKMLALSPVPAAPEEPTGPEAELGEADDLLREGKGLDAGKIYKRVYEQLNQEADPPKHLQARCLAGLARCALATGHAEEAEQLVLLLKKRHEAELKAVPEVSSAVAFVEMALKAPKDDGGSAEETLAKLQEAVKKEPASLEARHELALKLFQLQRFEEAINEALEILKRDKTWNDGAARQLLLQIFDALGPGNQLAKQGRSRMTNYLFL